MGDRYSMEELEGTNVESTGCKLELAEIFEDGSVVEVFTYNKLVDCELGTVVFLVDIVLVELLFGYVVLSDTVLVEFMLAAIELSIEVVTNLVDFV